MWSSLPDYLYVRMKNYKTSISVYGGSVGWVIEEHDFFFIENSQMSVFGSYVFFGIIQFLQRKKFQFWGPMPWCL